MAGASWRTAITRRRPSLPVRFLEQNELLRGRVLDYGCGRGADVQHLGVVGWDPHYQPVRPRGQFDTVLCLYVLNVLNNAERQQVYADLQALLRPGGVVYFAVRRDLDPGCYWTGVGTYQEYVTLPLPVLHDASAWVLYQATRPQLQRLTRRAA